MNLHEEILKLKLEHHEENLELEIKEDTSEEIKKLKAKIIEDANMLKKNKENLDKLQAANVSLQERSEEKLSKIMVRIN